MKLCYKIKIEGQKDTILLDDSIKSVEFNNFIDDNKKYSEARIEGCFSNTMECAANIDKLSEWTSKTEKDFREVIIIAKILDDNNEGLKFKRVYHFASTVCSDYREKISEEGGIEFSMLLRLVYNTEIPDTLFGFCDEQEQEA